MRGSFSQFLKERAKLAVRYSIGVGIVAIAAGARKVFIYFDKKREKSASTPSVIINPDAAAVVAPINERLDELAAQVARDKHVPVAPLRAVLVKLGEKGVPKKNIPDRLGAAAYELIKLRAENEQLRRAPPEFWRVQPALAAIAEEVQALIDKGEFDDARRALTRGRVASRALRIDASRYEAAFLAQEARVDDLQLAYRAAATKYAEAAGLVAPFDTEQQWRFLIDQAGELLKQGDEFFDNAALAEAIDVYRRCLALAQRSERPLDWVGTQNSLGLALRVLGERESHAMAIDFDRPSCLPLAPRSERPLDWAMTHKKLGTSPRVLGERESGTARFEEAVAAHCEALQENTRVRAPLVWATTQLNLGHALCRLGEREGSTAPLEEAVAAYDEASDVYSRGLGGGLGWIMTQMNRNIALAMHGDMLARCGDWEGDWERGKKPLEETVDVYRETLQERPRARAPRQWAMTQKKLGTALRMLGERESGTAKLEESVSAFREALQEWTRARVPLEWAWIQNNLALVHFAFFDKDQQPHHLDDALEAADGALEEFRKANAAFYIDKAERRREKILTAKGKL